MDNVRESENCVDKEEFISLINKNRLKLYKTAISILKNDEDANDAIQETLLSSYKNYNSLKDKNLFTRSFFTFLFIFDPFNHIGVNF